MKNITKANTTNATPADGNAERSYRKALKRERDRARSKRQYRQGKFEASLLSLDQLIDTFKDPSSAAAFSDGGAGAEAVIDHCDGVTPETRHAECIRNARRQISRAHPEWLEVFDLIVKNSRNRTESICQMVLSKR